MQRPCAKTGGTKSDAESVKVADSIGHGRSDQYRAVQYRGMSSGAAGESDAAARPQPTD